jgi:hypothetical protein
MSEQSSVNMGFVLLFSYFHDNDSSCKDTNGRQKAPDSNKGLSLTDLPSYMACDSGDMRFCVQPKGSMETPGQVPSWNFYHESADTSIKYLARIQRVL